MNSDFSCVASVNDHMDYLKKLECSAVVVATEDFSDGYYRVVTTSGKNEREHIVDLLSGMAQASMALHGRLEEIDAEIKDER